MEKQLNHEIERLESLQKKNNHIRPEEIDLAKNEKAALETLIDNATVRMDAIQLIEKGG